MHPKTWSRIRQNLHAEYPPSFFFRSKMKDRLGFSIREHNAWVENKNYRKELKDYQQLEELVMLKLTKTEMKFFHFTKTILDFIILAQNQKKQQTQSSFL